MYWLCDIDVSPLFQDWSHLMDRWTPLTTDDEAWEYVSQYLINRADRFGKGCLDIAKAQTQGNNDTTGVQRIEHCGGQDLIKHRYPRWHINFQKDGQAWAEEKNGQAAGASIQIPRSHLNMATWRGASIPVVRASTSVPCPILL